MSSRTQIPQRATLSEVHSGIVPSAAGAANAGKRAVLQVWDNYESHGYQTGYMHIPAKYVRWMVDGRTLYTRRFTGNNLRQVASVVKDFTELVLPDQP